MLLLLEEQRGEDSELSKKQYPFRNQEASDTQVLSVSEASKEFNYRCSYPPFWAQSPCTFCPCLIGEAFKELCIVFTILNRRSRSKDISAL
jgi:hypothetical protein